MSLRLRVVYLVTQALLIPAWWISLGCSPAVRAIFLPAGVLDRSFLALFLPDLVIIFLASLASARFILERSPKANGALWFLSGGLAYATLYTMAWTFLTPAPAIGLLLMLAACVGTHLIHRASI